jgi:alpha-2-macroglobulin
MIREGDMRKLHPGMIPSDRFMWLTLAFMIVLLSIPGRALNRVPEIGFQQSQAANWTEVERLISGQKMQDALALTEKLRVTAQKSGDGDEWTRALIKEVQLRTALSGYETSVRFLKDQPWPEGLLQRSALNLFFAHALVNYYDFYSYEINRREKVESAGVVDLKAWTKEQIYGAAQKAFEELWQQREALGKEPVERLSEYLTRNNYPKGIRDTLRDAVTYQYVSLLGNTSLWNPAESNEIYRLDLNALIAGAAAGGDASALLDPAVHPLGKISILLRDLENWHLRNGNRQAALEARLECLRQLHGQFTDPDKRIVILSELARVLGRFSDVPWWSAGKAAQAEFLRSGAGAGKLVRARAAADEGWKAYPNSAGSKLCLEIIQAIDTSDFQIGSMSSDGLQKRSIEVRYKNLAALYFRAYDFDLEERLKTARDYNLLPSAREVRTIMSSRKPAVEWRIELAPTRDFEMHRAFVTAPIQNPGCYAIVASLNREFSDSGNRIETVNLIVSDLVLLSQRGVQSELDLRVQSGETGRPVAGATIILYRYNYQTGHQKAAELLTNQEGTAEISRITDRNASYFFVSRKGQHVAISNQGYFYGNEGSQAMTTALIYTDRSIYRPLQKIQWKVLLYRRRADGEFRLVPSASATVILSDANQQMVDEHIVTTNEFGSAAGEFTIPSGRLLGNWSILCNSEGTRSANQTRVRVEEYKRPTFEVMLQEPKSALRLNRPAVLEGEAKYYFGLPVTGGLVKWRVVRQPNYPIWWTWSERYAPGSAQVVASGTVPIKEDGKFAVSFTPQADESLATRSRDITYRYNLAADVTDEGGETRSVSRAFTLGFVSIRAQITAGKGFFREDLSGTIEIYRTDLDDIPRNGRGTWRVVALRQPSAPALPADIPLDSAPDESKEAASYRTPGDLLRPRWNSPYYYSAVMHRWPDGPESAHGELNHDSDGRAEAVLPALRAGAYRLYYETNDDFGARYQTTHEFVVAGPKTSLALPLLLIPETQMPSGVGTIARFLALSGLPDQVCYFEIYRSGFLLERRTLVSGKDPSIIEIPIREANRGGFSVKLSALRDYQLMSAGASVSVPWDNKQLRLEFATFRDKLTPGSKESWRVTVKGPAGATLEAGTAELLAYMYDKSLDAFAAHHPPNLLGIYPNGFGGEQIWSSLGQSWAQFLVYQNTSQASVFSLHGDQLNFYARYGVGGPGRGGRGGGVGGVMEAAQVLAIAPARQVASNDNSAVFGRIDAEGKDAKTEQEVPLTVRSEFAETAFWRPQLLTGPNGSATIEFTVPDSVTSWNVWVHGVTRDLMGGSLHQETRSVKELMIRPYVPRFLREGDKAELKVVVNNASGRALSGKVNFDVLDSETQESLLQSFSLPPTEATRSFSVGAGGGANVSFPIVVPAKVGQVAFKVTATSEDVSDGELRPLPILPGRMHLMQSRFVALKNKDRREMTFEDLKKNDDPTRTNEQMVVTFDAQLFYSVLSALPYLVNYPYECTEQTLNRFVSTGILSGLYRNYPAVAKMAAEFAKRDEPLETWAGADPNRKMALEETPWIAEAQGGKTSSLEVANVLDPRRANAEQDAALAKLRKAQTANGAFPWWPGGPPSPYMTLYIMYGLAKAAEFGVAVPKEVVQQGWSYLAQHFRDEYAKQISSRDCCWEFLTFLNYVASCYPDETWTENALTPQQRRDILNFSFKHWRDHSPYLKCQLALTLKRAGRPQDAALVFASVMDSAKSTQDEGTFWAQEDRSWLWYNDTIESHAFALRTLMELTPEDSKKDGLVQWIFLNKKLNHWKSTRATAEVIYALVHYLQREGTLGAREDATVRLGGQTVQYVFEPDQYTGKKNQTVVAGEKVDGTYSTVTVEKGSPGFVFASATWQFSSERLPEQGSGDFLSVSRTYFKRENTGREFVLRPLAEGAVLQPGDEVEVQLSIRSKHPAEYIHLRDPRAAGFEPVDALSRYRWNLGIGWYEEVRDSGTNFFFEQLPQGEYTFKYRLKANMSGTFRVSPATLQSMYAPEFAAYSAGAILTIK